MSDDMIDRKGLKTQARLLELTGVHRGFPSTISGLARSASVTRYSPSPTIRSVSATTRWIVVLSTPCLLSVRGLPVIGPRLRVPFCALASAASMDGSADEAIGTTSSCAVPCSSVSTCSHSFCSTRSQRSGRRSMSSTAARVSEPKSPASSRCGGGLPVEADITFRQAGVLANPGFMYSGANTPATSSSVWTDGLWNGPNIGIGTIRTPGTASPSDSASSASSSGGPDTVTELGAHALTQQGRPLFSFFVLSLPPLRPLLRRRHGNAPGLLRARPRRGLPGRPLHDQAHPEGHPDGLDAQRDQLRQADAASHRGAGQRAGAGAHDGGVPIRAPLREEVGQDEGARGPEVVGLGGVEDLGQIALEGGLAAAGEEAQRGREGRGRGAEGLVVQQKLEVAFGDGIGLVAEEEQQLSQNRE
ncbi:hypothetical protein ColKHC_06709 [Colletotrichum higginsianum]|nr:hypothetical protein ColKHC_06709 [Colletotrichum higginsianum]